MNDSKRNEFIKRRPDILWDVPDDEITNVSDSFLLVRALNYLELPEIKELFAIFGLDYAAEVFRSLKGRQKSNIYPEIYALFSNYFDRYAKRNTL